MERADLETQFEREFEVTHDNYRALCPFHDERTPSFLIHQNDLIGHCFGCGVGGTVDSLLSRYLSVSIEEARRRLGITAQDSFVRARSKEGRRQEAPKYYPESWLAPFKKEVHKYVTGRGFHLSTIREAGSLYDAALQRQVFPHRDAQGRLLGVTGRSCRDQEPKWYHYWGYDKGSALYRGGDLDETEPVIVVEGVFDLLWLRQNGYSNVVASLGAGLTTSQTSDLRGLSGKIILGFDNDDPGQSATERAYRVLYKTSKVTFIKWPRGAHDWMDLTRGEIEDLVENRVSFVQKTLSHELA